MSVAVDVDPPSATSQTSVAGVPSNPRSSGRGILFGSALTLSLLALWFVTYIVVLSPFYEARQQAVLYSKMRETLALQTAPLGGLIEPGTPVALIDAPTVGLHDAVVVEGTASGDLMKGPGHRRDTVLPGQIGVSVIMGRSAMFGAPMSRLSHARVGDLFSVTTGQGVFTYVVRDVRLANDPLPPALQQGKGRLTVVSAVGDGRLGNWLPSGLVYVDADLKGDAQQYPPGRPILVPTSELPMHGDVSALLPLAITLPLLVFALVAVLWIRTRWGVWQAWCVGVPVVLAALFMISTNAVQLLPNLL